MNNDNLIIMNSEKKDANSGRKAIGFTLCFYLLFNIGYWIGLIRLQSVLKNLGPYALPGGTVEGLWTRINLLHLAPLPGFLALCMLLYFSQNSKDTLRIWAGQTVVLVITLIFPIVAITGIQSIYKAQVAQDTVCQAWDIRYELYTFERLWCKRLTDTKTATLIFACLDIVFQLWSFILLLWSRHDIRERAKAQELRKNYGF